MKKTQSLLFFFSIAILSACNSSQKSAVEKVQPEQSFQELRNSFSSSLVQEMKSPQPYDDLANPPSDMMVVHYPSEGRKLQALLHTSNIDSTRKTKAIVYLHGGFALGYSDVTDCQPFIDAGFVVLAPSYRGENDNDGNFEYFYGEVEDAENAVKWLATQSYIDAENIYVFGHSIGGGMSLLLSMNNNNPAQMHGSSSGLYYDESLAYLTGEENIPFNPSDVKEYFFRCPVYGLNLLPQKHFMYIGADDYFEENLEAVYQLHGNKAANLKMIKLAGDHFSSLQPAMKAFISDIEKAARK